MLHQYTHPSLCQHTQPNTLPLLPRNLKLSVSREYTWVYIHVKLLRRVASCVCTYAHQQTTRTKAHALVFSTRVCECALLFTHMRYSCQRYYIYYTLCLCPCAQLYPHNGGDYYCVDCINTHVQKTIVGSKH